MTKERAPRNQTLTVSKAEKAQLLCQTVSLSEPATIATVENKLIHQNLFSALEFLPESFADLMIVDPPYNLSKQFGKNKFSKTSSAGYEAWFESWLKEIVKCLKDDASIYVCCDWKSSKEVQAVLDKYFIIRNRITWEREKGRGAKANWKNCSEDIWFCTLSKDYFFDVEAVKLKKRVIAPYRDTDRAPKDWEETDDGNYRLTSPSNLWTDISVPFWSMPENTDHPTQKPEKLVAKLILASSRPGGLVFDPFSGSGTTCVTAKKLGRTYAGVEQEEEYCEIAVKRLMRAETDKTIQGFYDGYFWERNSLADQKAAKPKNRIDKDLVGSFDE